MSKRDRDIAENLGDFTATPRLLIISAFAAVIGLVGAFVALGLLKLIGLFTNLFCRRLSTPPRAMVSHRSKRSSGPLPSSPIPTSRCA